MALAGYLPPLVAQVIMDTKGLSAGMAEAKVKMGAFSASMSKLATVGKFALGGIVVGAAAVGYESVKMAMNFDQAMELIHTQAGVAQDKIAGLSQAVLNLAPQVGIGPEELATGLYHIASTGLDASKQIDVLTQAAHLAKIGMASLDDVTYAMSGVMSVGMKDVHDAADAISFMNATVGMGDLRMDALTRAIGTGILPTMQGAGLGMRDFAAAIATLGDNSVPADESATRLRHTITMMAAPNKKATDDFAKMGLSQLQLANDMRGPGGLLAAILDLKSHLDAYSSDPNKQFQLLSDAFGGAKTASTIQTLVLESGKLQQKYTQMGTAAGRAAATQDAWSKQQGLFKQQLDELIARLQVWGIKIGNFLIPKIQELVTWISKHKELVKVLAIAIGSVLVVAIGAYAVAMTQAAIATVVATWPILAIIAVVALLAVGIYELYKHWNTVWGWIKHIADDAWQWIYRYVWKDGIDKAFTEVKGWLTDLQNAWNDCWTAVGGALQWAWDHTIGPIIGWIQDGINAVSNTLSALTGGGTGANPGDVRGHSMNSGLPHKAMGGTVAGPIGSPQLIVAHGGETVYPPGKGGGGGGGDVYLVATFVTPDGQVIQRQTLRAARQRGFPNTAAKYLTPANANSVIR